MPNTIPGKKDQEKRDKQLAQKIKPKLRKYLIDTQVTSAAKVSKERKEESEEMSKSDELIQRATQLSHLCFDQKKLWKLYPPALSTKWMRYGTISQEMIHEYSMDVAAFAAQLVREYRVFLREQNSKRGYLNPMDEKNLMFFWAKFNADIRLLIQADKLNMERGNQGVVIHKKV